MAGMPLPELQHILGHKDIRTTVRYTHWLPHYQAVDGSQFDLLKQLEQHSLTAHCFSKLSHKDCHILRRKPSHQDNGKCYITFRIVELNQWEVINGTAITVSKIPSGIVLVVTDIVLCAKVNHESNGVVVVKRTIYFLLEPCQ